MSEMEWMGNITCDALLPTFFVATYNQLFHYEEYSTPLRGWALRRAPLIIYRSSNGRWLYSLQRNWVLYWQMLVCIATATATTVAVCLRSETNRRGARKRDREMTLLFALQILIVTTPRALYGKSIHETAAFGDSQPLFLSTTQQQQPQPLAIPLPLAFIHPFILPPNILLGMTRWIHMHTPVSLHRRTGGQEEWETIFKLLAIWHHTRI